MDKVVRNFDIIKTYEGHKMPCLVQVGRRLKIVKVSKKKGALKRNSAIFNIRGSYLYK